MNAYHVLYDLVVQESVKAVHWELLDRVNHQWV